MNLIKFITLTCIASSHFQVESLHCLHSIKVGPQELCNYELDVLDRFYLFYVMFCTFLQYRVSKVKVISMYLKSLLTLYLCSFTTIKPKFLVSTFTKLFCYQFLFHLLRGAITFSLIQRIIFQVLVHITLEVKKYQVTLQMQFQILIIFFSFVKYLTSFMVAN